MQSTSPRPSPNCGSDDLRSTFNTRGQVHTELSGHHKPFSREEFKIAVICALPLEFDAMCLVFDEFWDEDGDPYGTAPGDANTYTTGRIGDQNVVLALLQRMGKTSAASAVASMKLSYTGLRQAFLVGICGGVPRTQNGSDIMLGDVIISRTIVQYDFGKRYPDRFIRKYTTTEAQSNDFRGLTVMAETMRGRNKLRQAASKFLSRLQDNANRSGCGTKYVYPGLARDKLFEPNYRHKHHESPSCACKECHDMTSPVCDEALTASCSELGCSSEFLVARARSMHSQDQQQDASTSNTAQMLAIHTGSIASGDTVMKSGVDRDIIAKKEAILAFEMEAAGIWDEIPCLVIKGVSDYADSHKHSEWQDFAAATAAATVNALLIAQAEKDKARLEREPLATFLQSLNPDDRERALVFFRFAFGQQPRLMKQVLFSPALVIDARGRNLPFHLETISSKELFIHILKERFKDIGSSKIDKGEWFLEDQNSKVKLNLSKPWLSIIKPYSVLKMSMVFYAQNEDRTECSSCQVASYVSIMKSKQPLEIHSSPVDTFAKLGSHPPSIIQCFTCGSSHIRIEEAQDPHYAITTHTVKMVNRPQPYTIIHKQYPRVSPAHSRVSLNPADFEQDIARYKHVHLLDANILTHTIGFITNIGEQDSLSRLFLGHNYINIEMGVTTFYNFIFKAKLRKLFLKKVSDILDDNSFFSLNNVDIETAELAVNAELRKLEQDRLEMVELKFMCAHLKIRLWDHIKTSGFWHFVLVIIFDILGAVEILGYNPI